MALLDTIYFLCVLLWSECSPITFLHTRFQRLNGMRDALYIHTGCISSSYTLPFHGKSQSVSTEKCWKFILKIKRPSRLILHLDYIFQALNDCSLFTIKGQTRIEFRVQCSKQHVCNCTIVSLTIFWFQTIYEYGFIMSEQLLLNPKHFI